MRRTSFFGKIVKCTALALVFGTVTGAAFSGANYAFESFRAGIGETKEQAEIRSEKIQPVKTTAQAESVDISGVVEKVMPSVVAITGMTQQEISSFFGQGPTIETPSSGSGILVSKDEKSYYIATNNHVVEGTNTLTVQFADGTQAPAAVRGTAPADDLAVVEVAISDISEETKGKIKLAALGDSDALAVGNAVIAIGNALGSGQSVTMGVVSALDRKVTLQDERTGETVSNRLIQTDAAINPGNSGGALMNVKGEVIGINSSKYSDTAVEGMGFAIPMAVAGPILEDLTANGKTTTTGSPSLGIYGLDMTEAAAKYNMPQGVYVDSVIPGGGAANAGIAEGSIITKIDGEEITSMEELKDCLSNYKVGDTVTVTVQILDNGAYVEKEIPVTLTVKSY